LRSDKSISSWGLEARTPLLDKTWVRFYLSLPIQLRNHTLENNIEKYLIRKAFDYPLFFENKEIKNILPNEVLWRKKEAFSDGVSKKTRSWYEIIQESVELIDDLECIQVPSHLDTCGQPITLEQRYYYMLFNNKYPKRESILKYYWMPKYVKSYDSSARTLDVYNNTHEKNKVEENNNIKLY
jgi:asparagine synthase (glutamine-hydrolysing)